MTTRYYSLQGTSGVGKGTRTLQLIMYLIDKGFDHKIGTLNLNGNQITLGLYFKDFDTLFIGKVSRGIAPFKLKSWTSGDAFTGNTIRYYPYNDKYDIQGSNFINVLLNSLDTSMVCEGYPGTCPDPVNIGNTIGHDNVWCIYFEYPKENIISSVQERCYSRTGKRPKAVSSASSQNKCNSAYEASLAANEHAFKFPYNAPVNIFGTTFLESKKPELIDDFLKYCESHDWKRHVEMSNKEEYDFKLTALYDKFQNLNKEDLVDLTNKFDYSMLDSLRLILKPNTLKVSDSTEWIENTKLTDAEFNGYYVGVTLLK